MNVASVLLLRCGLTPREVTFHEAMLLYENREELFGLSTGGSP